MPSDTQQKAPKKGPEMDSLKLAKLKQQQRELLDKLEKMETQTREADTNYRWSLLTLTQLLQADEEKAPDPNLATLQQLIHAGASPEALKTMLIRLKDLVSLKETKVTKNTGPKAETKPAEPQKKRSPAPSILNWLKKNGQPEPAQSVEVADDTIRLKATYQEIINELRLNLDPSTLEKLRAIENSLKEAASSDDFLAIRKSILNLIKEYISRISKEREEAALFIREIGERLIEVEGHMINSLSFAKDAHQVSSSFTDTLEGQLVEFKQTIDISRDLSELKTAVASRLSSIKTVLENKRQDDSVRLRQADRQMQQLQQNLTEMKGEIQTAWQRAKSLERELLIDPLTGIYNRRAYDRRIVEETERYQRYQRTFSLLIFDVDYFKRVNDLYGHSVGDMCLKEIVHRIKPVLRKSDFMARFGGEEFAVIVPETGSAGAADVAEKLRQTVEATKFIYKTDSVAITVSVGVTEIVPADKTHEDIFTRADRALYNAKQSGRNRVNVL
ncbi:MAG: diguanylate cyclase [Pseudomonadota bacterium]